MIVLQRYSILAFHTAVMHLNIVTFGVQILTFYSTNYNLRFN